MYREIQTQRSAMCGKYSSITVMNPINGEENVTNLQYCLHYF